MGPMGFFSPRAARISGRYFSTSMSSTHNSQAGSVVADGGHGRGGVAVFEITGNQTAAQSVQLLTGILLGTLCWWSVLSGITAIFRERVNDRAYQFLNRLLGCLLVMFAGVVLARGLFPQ